MKIQLQFALRLLLLLALLYLVWGGAQGAAFLRSYQMLMLLIPAAHLGNPSSKPVTQRSRQPFFFFFQ